jgi:glycosyltransferase involved in cell wall biosynthesis
MLGHVPRIEDELARADLVVVPLLSGTGTRLKILEAWAHRIPVVSTAKGAEGLEATNGEHLSIADEPDDFVAACVRSLLDLELRRHMTQAAFSRFASQYSWSQIGRRLQVLLDRALGLT